MIRLLATGLAVLANSAAAELCVTNDDTETRFFATKSRDGPRATATLPPGARLCVAGLAGGRVWAFETPDAVEGCGRLVPPRRAEALVHYASFDNCRWASHDD